MGINKLLDNNPDWDSETDVDDLIKLYRELTKEESFKVRSVVFPSPLPPHKLAENFLGRVFSELVFVDRLKKKVRQQGFFDKLLGPSLKKQLEELSTTRSQKYKSVWNESSPNQITECCFESMKQILLTHPDVVNKELNNCHIIEKNQKIKDIKDLKEKFTQITIANSNNPYIIP